MRNTTQTHTGFVICHRNEDDGELSLLSAYGMFKTLDEASAELKSALTYAQPLMVVRAEVVVDSNKEISNWRIEPEWRRLLDLPVVPIVLTDAYGNTINIECVLNELGTFDLQATESSDKMQETSIASFPAAMLEIDGDGWRDLEAGGYLGEFISDVLYGDTDADEFLTNIAEVLGTQDDPGMSL